MRNLDMLIMKGLWKKRDISVFNAYNESLLFDDDDTITTFINRLDFNRMPHNFGLLRYNGDDRNAELLCAMCIAFHMGV